MKQKHYFSTLRSLKRIKTQVKMTREPNTSNRLFKRRKANHPKLEVTKSIHWNTPKSNRLEYAKNLTRNDFNVVKPKTLDWYMPEAIPVPESIQLDYA